MRLREPFRREAWTLTGWTAAPAACDAKTLDVVRSPVAGDRSYREEARRRDPKSTTDRANRIAAHCRSATHGRGCRWRARSRWSASCARPAGSPPSGPETASRPGFESVGSNPIYSQESVAEVGSRL